MNCALNFHQSALWYISSLTVKSHGSLTGPVVIAVQRTGGHMLEEEYWRRHKHEAMFAAHVIYGRCHSAHCIYSRAEGSNVIL